MSSDAIHFKNLEPWLRAEVTIEYLLKTDTLKVEDTSPHYGLCVDRVSLWMVRTFVDEMYETSLDAKPAIVGRPQPIRWLVDEIAAGLDEETRQVVLGARRRHLHAAPPHPILETLALDNETIVVLDLNNATTPHALIKIER